MLGLWLMLISLSADAASDSPAPTPLKVTLEGIRRQEDPSCGKGHVLLEAIYRVTGADPVELLIERTPVNGAKSLLPVSHVDREGRVLDGRGVAPQYSESAEVRLHGVLGGVSEPVRVAADPQTKSVDNMPAERIAVNRASRHQQFASDKSMDRRGTCCWHYLYLAYPWQREEPVKEITIPVTFEPFPLDGGHLFLQLHSAINGIPFYFGLQTELRLHDKRYGPGAILSRWESQDPADLKSASGGFSEIGAYEGRFVSVRKPFKPGNGPMSLRLRVQPDPTGRGNVWLEMAVIRHLPEGGTEEHQVGAVRFPGTEARLTKRLKVAVESYDLKNPALSSTWRVPCFVWSIAPPRLDGVPLSKSPRIDYPDGSPRLVRASTDESGVVRARRVGWTWNGQALRACEIGMTQP
ncbi:MAG: hypothetical protein HQL86_08250 [Magnetococcales bacterium]|nr:hypothetical protein [Magnetococcales bacterium]